MMIRSVVIMFVAVSFESYASAQNVTIQKPIRLVNDTYLPQQTNYKHIFLDSNTPEYKSNIVINTPTCCQTSNTKLSKLQSLKLWQWLGYHSVGKCNKGCGCCFYCSPSLYSYFGANCREGAKYDSASAKPCPSSCISTGWGNVWNTGARMFASPTGHGFVGSP